MDFFDGEFDVEDVLGELEDLFPLRVRIGALDGGASSTGGPVAGGKTSPTGGLVPSRKTSDTGGLIPGAFNEAPGLGNVPAQRSDAKAGETIGANKTVTHLWTLPGAWPQVKAGQVLLDGNDRYEILLADVHTFGLHTDLKTLKVTQ